MDKPQYDLVGVTMDLSKVVDLETTPDYVEFRIDSSANPLEQLSEYGGSIPLIVSCGSGSGNSDERDACLEPLVQASKFKIVEKVDLRLEAVSDVAHVLDDFHENDVEIIISYYNYDNTPNESELLQVIEEGGEHGDIVKIVTFANDPGDAVTLLRALSSATESGQMVAGYALGDIGRHTRTMGPFYGSKLCYGWVEDSDVEPGEIKLGHLDELLDSAIHGGDHVELIESLEMKFNK